MMSLIRKIRDAIVKSYRIIISYDMPVIYHMVINRLKYRHHSDFRIADRPYKFQFIRRHYGHLIEKCRQNPISNKPNEGPIWVCWWQGEDQMPDIIRLCYASLKKNATGDRPIIFLHSGNYSTYADIPRYILDKFERKLMSITHFTDILRMTLLAKHGGLWIDASVFLSSKMPDSVFEKPYFTCTTPAYPNSIAQSKYTVFLLGAAAGAPWIVLARDVLYEYWKTSWALLDYMLVNYILTLGLNSIPELQAQIQECVYDTPHMTEIQDRRNDKCDPNLYHRMMSECSFYKLTYKLDFKEQDEHGNLTYYGMLRASTNTPSC